jgi:UDP-N-acetylmuramyl tripeptide synthase
VAGRRCGPKSAPVAARLQFTLSDGESAFARLPLLGRFNIDNLLAVAGTCARLAGACGRSQQSCRDSRRSTVA